MFTLYDMSFQFVNIYITPSSNISLHMRMPGRPRVIHLEIFTAPLDQKVFLTMNTSTYMPLEICL